jgi:hypothetical protein
MAPVRLYLDCIDQIVKCLQELSSEAEIVLATPGREFATVEELSGLGRQEVPTLEIRCCVNPRRLYDFIVSFGAKTVFLCRTGDTLAHRRIFTQIEALLLARRRGWQWRDRLLLAAGLLGSLSAAVFMFVRSGLLPWLPTVGAVLTAMSLCLSAVYLATRRWSTSKIVLGNRLEHRIRRERVIGALIVVALIVVMALVTMGLAYLAQILEHSVT